MTVPIIPGPFSFLSDAGTALGQYGAVRTEAKRHAQEVAAQGVTAMSHLVELGILPASTLDTKEARHLLEVSGVNIPPSTTTLPQPKEIAAKRVAGMAPGSTEQSLALGLPTPGAVATDTLTAKTAGAKIAAGVPEKGAAAEAATADVTTAQANVQSQLFAGMPELFQKDPQMKALAQEALLGTLPYRIAEINSRRIYASASRAAELDETRLLLGVWGDVNHAWQKAVDDYNAVRRAAIIANKLGSPDDPQTIKAYDEANRDQMPKWEDITAPVFAASGLSPDDFAKAMKTHMHILSESPSETPRAGGKTGGKPTDNLPPPGGGADTPGPEARISSIISTTVHLKPEELDGAAGHLADHVNDGSIGQIEAKMIFTRLARSMPANDFRRFQASFNYRVKVYTEHVEPGSQ